MWRALFVALGFYCFVLGVECLLVEKVELTNRGNSQSVFGHIESSVRGREIEPPDWAPWSLMSTGAVTSCIPSPFRSAPAARNSRQRAAGGGANTASDERQLAGSGSSLPVVDCKIRSLRSLLFCFPFTQSIKILLRVIAIPSG